MSELLSKVKIETLFYRVNREKVKFLKPSHNLRETRDTLNQMIVERALEVNTTAEQILSHVDKLKSNKNFNFNDLAKFRELKSKTDEASKKFITWSTSLIEEVDRLWLPHIKKTLAGHLTNQDLLLFEKILVDTLHTVINRIVDSEEIKRLSDTVSITSDSNNSVVFCGKHITNIKFSEIEVNCIYFNPHKEFEAYMHNKDVILLQPIREIWAVLQAYDWYVNNDVTTELNSHTDIQIRQKLLLANYQRLFTKYRNQKDAIEAFLRQEVLNVDMYRWPQKGMSYETIKKDVQKLFPKR